MKPGFSTLELIIVMTVSAVMMTSLFAIYNQVSRNMIRTEQFVFEDMQIMTLRNRFQKDLSGVSAIWFTQAALQAKLQAVPGQAKEPLAKTNIPSRYFYSVNKGNRFDCLTFVTTSALQSYGSTQAPFVRVVYRLEDDPRYQGLFRLVRKEIATPTESIEQQDLEKGPFYELVGGVASLEISYEFVDTVALEKQMQSNNGSNAQNRSGVDQKADVKKPSIQRVKEWKESLPSKKTESLQSAPQVQDDQSKEDLGGATGPQFVHVNIVFGATDRHVEKKYQFDFYIPSIMSNLPQDIIKQPKP